MDVDQDLINEIVGLSTDDAKFEETCLSITNSIRINSLMSGTALTLLLQI